MFCKYSIIHVTTFLAGMWLRAKETETGAALPCGLGRTLLSLLTPVANYQYQPDCLHGLLGYLADFSEARQLSSTSVIL